MPLHGLTDRFLTAVANDHRSVVKVECRTAKGVLVQDISTLVLTGSMTADETREIRRTIQMTLVGSTALVPAGLGDMLHPASGNELWVYRGVQYSDGTTEYAQLGVFRMTKPNVTDDGETISITINGQDRASVVARIDWTIPYTVPAGSNLGGALALALQNRIGAIYPALSYVNIAPDTFLFPATVWGADPSTTGDPMQDFITFASNAGDELFFDVAGLPVGRQIANPLTTQPIDALHFVDGTNCVVDTAGRVLDESTAYNQVQLYCNGTGTALPFVVTVSDNNPLSPTWIGGPWGVVPLKITTTAIPAGVDSVVAAKAKATAMANKQLQLVLGSFDGTSLTCVPNPALREGDCVKVTHARMKINANYIISSMTIPLDPESDMAITFRPQVQAG